MTSHFSKITVLFLSWRDIRHPQKGGAEIYTHEVLKRLVKRGIEVEHFSVLPENGRRVEVIDGIKYLRSGSNTSVIPKAIAYYYRNQRRFSLVVDQCNTHRFFSSIWLPYRKRVFFIHQLTREIWWEMFPKNKAKLGNLFETIALKLNRKDQVITVSQSTKTDLIEAGFSQEKITIAPEGLVFSAWKPEEFLEKENNTLLYAGRINPYKGVETCIKVLAQLKQKGYKTRLWIVGKGDPDYIQNTLQKLIISLGLTFSEHPCDTRFQDVHFFGFVSDYDLRNLMSRSKALLFPSYREGWGLTVSESAIVGTPSIVWPSQGLIDAVNFGTAGYLCKEKSAEAMTEKVEEMLNNPEEYSRMRMQAYEFACTLTFNRSADVFEDFIKKVVKK